MYREYSNLEIVELLKRYMEDSFNIKENSDVIIFYNNDFFFNCVERNTMSSVSKIKLNDILKSCNSVDSVDAKFENSKDLLKELDSLVQCGSIVEHMVNYFKNEYEIMCISDED